MSITDPTLDPERRAWDNEARRTRVAARRRAKKIRDENIRKMRKMDRITDRKCVRCGNPGRGQTFGNKRKGPRICANCWRGMNQKERAAVKDGI